MRINLNYDQKKEIGVLIHQGDDDKALTLVRKYANVNSKEARQYIVRVKKHVVDEKPDTSEDEY